jgi:hypothetical protein
MKPTLLWIALLWLVAAPPARAQQAPAQQGVRVQAIRELPASYPRDVPVPQGAKPVAAGERDGSLIVLFLGAGKAEPMRAAYEAELPKHGWKVEGWDKIGDEQGLFAVQGERTLSVLFREHGSDLQIQLAHVPKTPKTPPPAPK